MQISEKSFSFAKKILKHYPVSQSTHNCEHTCQGHTHQAKEFQPFQHMHDHRKQREIYEKPTKQKLQNMHYFKELGNEKFKQKKYDEACYFYQKAILYSDYTFPQQKQQLAEMEVLVQQSNMNLAICLIKQNNWSRVWTHLNEATKCQQSIKNEKTKKLVLNTRKKAYYWLAKYYIQQGSYDKAEKQIQLLEELDHEISSKQQAAELKHLLASQIKKHQKKSEDISKKMFSIPNSNS